MTRYLISFDDGWMNFPEEDLPAIADAAHRVMFEAQDAGVWITGGGILTQRATIAHPDGSVTEGPFPETKAVLGGFCVIDVPTHEAAVEWATKTAIACRCAQEIRALGDDPDA